MSCSGEIVAENDLLQIKPAVTKKLKKAKYGIADHSTVELCHWTKKSFRGEGNCYKHKFYGISTHQCMEFSPAGMYCQNRCVYCWRPMASKLAKHPLIVEILLLNQGWTQTIRYSFPKVAVRLKKKPFCTTLSLGVC